MAIFTRQRWLGELGWRERTGQGCDHPSRRSSSGELGGVLGNQGTQGTLHQGVAIFTRRRWLVGRRSGEGRGGGEGARVLVTLGEVSFTFTCTLTYDYIVPLSAV